MLVMVSGPVSAESDKMRMDNTARLNRVAAAVLKRGHIPLVGVNAAAPVVEEVGVADKYATTMMICEALAERCDAILLIGEIQWEQRVTLGFYAAWRRFRRSTIGRCFLRSKRAPAGST
jgi:hypothetical protein